MDTNAKIIINLEGEEVSVDTSEADCISLRDQIEMVRLAYAVLAAKYESLMTLGDNKMPPS